MKWPEVCTFLLLTCSVSSELYSSTTDMVKLLDSEAIFIQTVQSFIMKYEDKIIKLKRMIDSYKDEHQLATKNITEYVSNPISSYKLVKRILSKWKTVENFLSDDLLQEIRRNMNNIKESKDFPTNDDLDGTTDALLRLQEIYKINITSLAEGNINGIKYFSQLSADECFWIGKHCFSNYAHHSCIPWMAVALNRLEREVDTSETSRREILEYMAFSAFKLGNITEAILIIDELIKIYPDHPRAPETRMYYVEELLKDPGVSEQNKNETISDELSETELYTMACRKEISPPISITSQLKCRYITNDIPFLRLAPFKEEEAYLNPKIVLFREVIYDSEIELIKELALPDLKRASVQSIENEVSKLRIGKLAWLEDKQHPVIMAISRRVEDITKLSVATAEDLQVVNYGIGGHYSAHYDYFVACFINISEEDNVSLSDTGNRIATLIFYMNDVAQGGATVFPNLHLGVWPEKGTALLWFNLLTDGQRDENTLHAGCPVLAGTKWIFTKWLCERDQEFRRPCELTPSKAMLMSNP